MPEWPSTLPDEPIESGYEETFADNLLRTEMDKGPPKVRRRTQANVNKATFPFIFTKAELGYFTTFYKVDLAEGALPVDWTHPIHGTSIQFNIVPPVKVTPIGGGFFSVNLTVEILP
jgi:hypothetical protein